MVHPRDRLYRTTGLICLLGVSWLGLGRFFQLHTTVCPVKLISGCPCPSCGSTRSIQLLLEGRWLDAIELNPLGLVSLLLFSTIAILLLIDLLTKRSYFYHAYQRTGQFLSKHRLLSVLLVALVIANWVWNIQKQL